MYELLCAYPVRIMKTDICAPDSPTSSPETTIYDLLSTRQRSQNDTVYQFVDFYTSVCTWMFDSFSFLSSTHYVISICYRDVLALLILKNTSWI